MSSATPVEQLNAAFEAFSVIAFQGKTGADVTTTMSAMFTLQKAIAEVVAFLPSAVSASKQKQPEEWGLCSVSGEAAKAASPTPEGPTRKKGTLYVLKVKFGVENVKTFTSVGAKWDNTWVEDTVKAIGGSASASTCSIIEPKKVEGGDNLMPTMFYKFSGTEAECKAAFVALDRLKAESKAAYEARKAERDGKKA